MYRTVAAGLVVLALAWGTHTAMADKIPWDTEEREWRVDTIPGSSFRSNGKTGIREARGGHFVTGRLVRFDTKLVVQDDKGHKTKLVVECLVREDREWLAGQCMFLFPGANSNFHYGRGGGLVASRPPAFDRLREWTDATTGNSVVGRPISVEGTISVKRKNSATIRIPLDIKHLDFNDLKWLAANFERLTATQKSKPEATASDDDRE